MIKEHIFLKIDFLSPPTHICYRKQNLNKINSLPCSQRLHCRKKHVAWIDIVFLNTSEKMPTSSQYSGQSSPLWSLFFNDNSHFLVFSQTNLQMVDCPCPYTLLEGIPIFETSPTVTHSSKRVVFFGRTCRGLYDMLSAKQHKQQWQHWTWITYVGSLQSSMVSRRLKGELGDIRWPEKSDGAEEKIRLSQWEIHGNPLRLGNLGPFFRFQIQVQLAPGLEAGRSLHFHSTHFETLAILAILSVMCNCSQSACVRSPWVVSKMVCLHILTCCRKCFFSAVWVKTLVL